MELNISRRAFVAGASALAMWPGAGWCAGDRRTGKAPQPLSSVWELPDGTASDGVMVRRMYLDLAGRIPTKEEAQEYVRSSAPDKRAGLVGRLLDSHEFADYWAMRFCDILRVKSEFPINLWPNAVYVYHGRIRSFVERNEPWDLFGRALLLSQGSNFRDAEVNFFRATDRRNPEGWAQAVAQTFLGVSPQALDAATKTAFESYLSNVRIKTTREWKEEIVYVDGVDRRAELCDRLFRHDRQLVADAFASRMKEWIFGPLSRRMPNTGSEMCGVKDAVRRIVLSSEYAQGSVTGGFPARRLDAEVLDDALCRLGGAKRDYQSPAPEPFSFLPPERATVCIEDGSISSAFLSLFGRPARDTGLMEERGREITSKQRLYLFNSGNVHGKLGHLAIPKWRLADGTINPHYRLPLIKRVDSLYWTLLSRAPSERERAVVAEAWRKRSRNGKDRKASSGEMMRDVAWCLVNSKEFLYRT